MQRSVWAAAIRFLTESHQPQEAWEAWLDTLATGYRRNRPDAVGLPIPWIWGKISTRSTLKNRIGPRPEITMKAAIQNAVPLGLGVGVAMAVGRSLEETSYWLRIIAVGLSGAMTAIVVHLILQILLNRRSE